MPHEYEPPTFYSDYQLSRPASTSNGQPVPQKTQPCCADEDEDRTDLATSNSLTSLTPVDEAMGQGFPQSSLGELVYIRTRILNLQSCCLYNSYAERILCADPVDNKSHQLTESDHSDGLVSSTPMKAKSSAINASTLQTVEATASDPSEVHTKSSSSISLVPSSSSSSSFERSSYSMTVSMNRKENDSLAQNLLDDFSGRICSQTDGNSFEGNLSGGGLLTDEEDYLNDEFEEEKNSEGAEVKISSMDAFTESDDDAKDVCGYDCDTVSLPAAEG